MTGMLDLRDDLPYVSGYLSPQLKPKNLKGEARGEDAKELFKRI
jgi:hypothetical protein